MPDLPAIADELGMRILAALEARQMRGSYGWLPHEVAQAVTAFEVAHGPSARADLLGLLLCRLISRFDEIRNRPNRLRIPSSILETTHVEHDRIRSEYSSGVDPGQSSLSSDIYLKDLAVATQKLLPAGAQLVDVAQGIPRRVLLSATGASPAAGISAAIFFAFQNRGFSPALEIHTSLKRLDEFTPAGWHAFYRRVAELLELNAAPLCMFGTSWFYDPAVAGISPNLSYLREEPEGHGARIFRVGEDEMTVRNAVSRSTKRRLLHEQGSYRPCAYMLVWPRGRMISLLKDVG